MKKKLLAVILTMLLIPALLASCGGNAETDHTDSGSSAVSQETSVNTEPEETSIDKDFKEMMDSYEDCIDQYVRICEEYEKGECDLDEYTEYLDKYTEFAEEVNDVDEDELTDDELDYYLTVTNRCNKKLLEVTYEE